MTVIEADGVNTEPLTVNSITIFAGQRYSFVLNANQKADNFWVRSEPQTGIDGGPGGFAGGINSAILRYAGAPSADPKTSAASTVVPLLEQNLHPLESPAAPGSPHAGGADVLIDLKLDTDTAAGAYTINGVSWKVPTVPVLLQILSGASSAQELLPKGSVFSLPPNKVIELSMAPAGAVGGPVSLLIRRLLSETDVGYSIHFIYTE